VSFPNKCAPGILGSADAQYQDSVLCAGKCPAGSSCPTEATTTAITCTRGNYCPLGTSLPLPCDAGSYSNELGNIASTSCTMCPAGSACPTGSTTNSICPPGSITATAGESQCSPCVGGTYQNVYGETSCKNCTSGSYCPSGSAIPTPCPAGTTSDPDIALMKNVSQCMICPAGYWCAPGIQVACDADFYNPNEGSVDQMACIKCPENSGTGLGVRGSTDISSCQCNPGYYDALAGPAVQCKMCPVGTACGRGATIQQLPLQSGFYRVHDNTTDVRKCPDATANCSATFGTAACSSSSGCLGGSNISAQCADGIVGTFCRTCIQDPVGPLVYYLSATDESSARCADCEGQLGVTIGMALLMLALLGAAVAGLALAQKRSKRFQQMLLTFKPQNKLKILIGFYIVATRVDTVYEVTLPNDVKAVMQFFSQVFTFGMQGVATTPLACMGMSGYVAELTFWILFPPIVVVLILLAVLLFNWYRNRSATTKKAGAALTILTSPPTSPSKAKSSGDGAHGGSQMVDANPTPPPPSQSYKMTLLEQTLPPVLQIMFILYPLVTNAAFAGFPCYEFEGGRGWLIADVNIECRTPPHVAATSLAWIAVFIYPIGMLVTTAVLLLRAKEAILSGVHTPLSRAIAFLYKEYDTTTYWWELMEMGRKFLLIGLFVTVAPGSIMQIAVGTIACAVYLLIQLQAKPFANATDDYLATGSSFGLMMIFICSIFFKYKTLTEADALQQKMSIEQTADYVISTTAISAILLASVFGSLLMVAVIAAVQAIVEARKLAALRRLKYAKDGKWVELTPLGDPQAFHLFLSHAWPAAQDRMRIIKARFAEALPSCKVFLDVDNLKAGSGTAEVDKSECILVFCTKAYFEKKNSLKELYRAVVQRRPILAVLEPDASQDGGLDQAAVSALLTDGLLDKFKLRKKWSEWADEGELLPAAFNHAPDGAECAAALFASPPVEWNRLPHFQDVTIRLIAQNGVLHGEAGELYLQGEAAMAKIYLPPPLKGREFHLFCSPHNAGATEVADDLKESGVFVTEGKKASAPLTYTTDVSKLASCDHMLVLLDDRTWASGEETAKLVEHIHQAMRLGVHLNCVHEFPSLVGPPRHECDFGLMFSDEWTPAHLTSGPTNLYKEIALALKGVEWRKPGMVAFAGKLAASAGPHAPIDVVVPDTYEAATDVVVLQTNKAATTGSGLASAPAPAPLARPAADSLLA